MRQSSYYWYRRFFIIKLCVAIPTYNSVGNVSKKLRAETDMFLKYGVDVVVCDSSTDNEIQSLCDEFRSDGYGNIFYIRYDSDIPSNEKVFRIFEWASGTEYDYIWLIHDHTICMEEAFEYLMRELEKGGDFYLLNMQSDDNSDRLYDDMDEFLVSGAWRLNSFGASVISTEMFLTGIDWDLMRRKFGRKETLNYSHIGLYFERLSQISNPVVYEVFFNRKDFMDFNRTKAINWRGDTIRICLECWGEVITCLPQCYLRKKEALKTQDRWFMSKYSLISYRKSGDFDLKTYFKYRKWIRLIYPEDIWRDFWISFLPVDASISFFCRGLYGRVRQIKRKHGHLYVFGAGRHASECASFLDDMGIEFDGFVVTDTAGNPENLNGLPVTRVYDTLRDKSSLVILGILSSGVPGVKKTLEGLTDAGTNIDIVEME